MTEDNNLSQNYALHPLRIFHFTSVKYEQQGVQKESGSWNGGVTDPLRTWVSMPNLTVVCHTV